MDLADDAGAEKGMIMKLENRWPRGYFASGHRESLGVGVNHSELVGQEEVLWYPWNTWDGTVNQLLKFCGCCCCCKQTKNVLSTQAQLVYFLDPVLSVFAK